jgi:hypothetical protein
MWWILYSISQAHLKLYLDNLLFYSKGYLQYILKARAVPSSRFSYIVVCIQQAVACCSSVTCCIKAGHTRQGNSLLALRGGRDAVRRTLRGEDAIHPGPVISEQYICVAMLAN